MLVDGVAARDQVHNLPIGRHGNGLSHIQSAFNVGNGNTGIITADCHDPFVVGRANVLTRHAHDCLGKIVARGLLGLLHRLCQCPQRRRSRRSPSLCACRVPPRAPSPMICRRPSRTSPTKAQTLVVPMSNPKIISAITQYPLVGGQFSVVSRMVISDW